jgi:eukaryotic-like serine/threonine-protein kinase
MLAEGDRIERYTVRATLGQGGMAVVYRVQHAQLGSDHALKLLTVSKPGVRRRLLKEGQAQAQLRHPNIVAVTDVLEVHGAPALVMEFVDGPDLSVWLHENRPDLATATTIFLGILAGVSRAHSAGLIHRDLKPGNVLMAPDGAGGWLPKVADFGLVKALDAEGEGQTRTGVGMGTPAFMAPEQYRSAKDTDARTDIFSLGCILYWLVCGRPPFVGDDLFELMSRIHEAGYPPPKRVVPDLPEAIDMAIRGCLEPDRDRRIQTCDTLLAVLRGEAQWAPAPLVDGHTMDFEGLDALGHTPAAAAAPGDFAAIRAAETLHAGPAPQTPTKGAGHTVDFGGLESSPARPRAPGSATPAVAAWSPRPQSRSAGGAALHAAETHRAQNPTAVPAGTEDSLTTLDPEASPTPVPDAVGIAEPPGAAERAPARPQPTRGPIWLAGAALAMTLGGLVAWTTGVFDADTPNERRPDEVASPAGAAAPSSASKASTNVGPPLPDVDEPAASPAVPPAVGARREATESNTAARKEPAPPAPSPAAGPMEPAAPPVSTAPPSDTTLAVEGGGLVRFVRDGVAHRPGAVQPGTYAINATFGGAQPRPAGSVTIAEGESITLHCNALLKTCAP